MKLITCLAAGLLLTFAQTAGAIPIVMTTDFINDLTRTGFNGFESAPATPPLLVSWAEDGILVETTGPGADMVACLMLFSPPTCQADEGARSWYDSSHGYTRIALSSVADLRDLGMLAGSGYATAGGVINYAALLNGVVRVSGFVAQSPIGVQYLGFSGGGFDEVWLNATHPVYNLLPAMPNTGAYNNIQIDSIETFESATEVPEPASLLLFGTGAGVLARARRRRAEF